MQTKIIELCIILYVCVTEYYVTSADEISSLIEEFENINMPCCKKCFTLGWMKVK